MSKDRGWIKLYRRVREDSVWNAEKFTKGQAWIDLLLKTKFAPYEFFKRGIKVSLQPGQLAESEDSLAKEWKWSRQKVRRFLRFLEIDGKIAQQKSRLISIITIVNWDFRQQNDTTDKTTDATTNGTTIHKKVKKKENSTTQKFFEKDQLQNEIALSLFHHWNEKKIVIHKVPQKFLPSIGQALQYYSLDEIKIAMDNYAMVVHDDRFYWTHRWSLNQFLQQKNGIDRFLPENFDEESFYTREYLEQLKNKKRQTNVA